MDHLQLFHDNLRLVGWVVTRNFGSLSPDRKDECYADGLLGLWEAARTWDGKRHFSTWATANIRWRISDGLRTDFRYLSKHQECSFPLDSLPAELVDPRAADPLREAQNADLLAFAARRCEKAWSLVKTLLDGGLKKDWANANGLDRATARNRLMDLRNRLGEDSSLYRELVS